MGLELVEVQVQDLGLPEEVEKAIDKRGAIAAVGDLRAYTQYETASSIRDAANNPGGAAGVGVGLGAGVAMGAQMMNTMSGVTGGGSAPVPPPLPGAAVFHIAVGQNQAGPFDMNALQQQVASGTLNRNTLVWKAGLAQWVKAGDVPELLPLFSNVPPPIPQ
jgi:membrane protease subunit (stomatin/prohibitin family)